MEENKYLCSNCDFEIQPDSDFCPRCGKIFAEEVKCEIHSQEDAKDVCVICSSPFCEIDGHIVNNVFFV